MPEDVEYEPYERSSSEDEEQIMSDLRKMASSSGIPELNLRYLLSYNRGWWI